MIALAAVLDYANAYAEGFNSPEKIDDWYNRGGGMTEAESMQLSHWLYQLGHQRYEEDYYDLQDRWDFERSQE